MEFNFSVILDTERYTFFYKKAKDNYLIRDICDDKYSNLTEEEIKALKSSKYINVVQKSNTWLTLRKQSGGTASSVGKYLYLKEIRFPTEKDVMKSWISSINDDPFIKTACTAGHMAWGVKYEETALMHFALEENLGVVQVGSIKVLLKHIMKIGESCFGAEWIPLCNDSNEEYLLVSPDGIVGKPEVGTDSEDYSEYVGMLEIKCISPFHHIETEDGNITWILSKFSSDFEGILNKRQWFDAKSIPFVYIIQQALQAISGIIKYKMNSKSFMWFIRWSPIGLSIFKFKFINLIRIGALAANLYFSLKNRFTTIEVMTENFAYIDKEQKIRDMLYIEYEALMKDYEYKYIDIPDYPEFKEYYEKTKDDVFIPPI